MKRKTLFTIAVGLSVVSIAATWLLMITQRHWTAVFSQVCIFILNTFFAITILGYVLRGNRVTTDKIFAAICVYLLIGYAWAFIYALLEATARIVRCSVGSGAWGLLARWKCVSSVLSL
jgi:hypothetical protein